LSIFLERYASNLKAAYFCTHQDGDEPRLDGYQDVQPWELPGNLGYWVESCQAPTILNIDLDYFSCQKTVYDHIQFMSDAYIRQIFSEVKRVLDGGKIAVLTICLSPECCGGWNEAENFCSIACEELGLEFSLPSAAA